MENLIDISEPRASKFRKMSKKINKFNFPSVYCNLYIFFLPSIFLNFNKPIENWIYWSSCSFGGTWGSETSAKFSTLAVPRGRYKEMLKGRP